MRALALVVTALLALFTARARAEPVTASATTCSCPEVPAPQVKLVDLNLASEAELMELPGVGPSKAQAILAFRAEHGGFSSVSQLLRIKGFGRATLRRLRPLLTLSPAASAPGRAPPAVR
jgi:competence protein ComEA